MAPNHPQCGQHNYDSHLVSFDAPCESWHQASRVVRRDCRVVGWLSHSSSVYADVMILKHYHIRGS